jgi:hypothetical protein
MLSNLLIIGRSDVLTLENEGKGYCLINAFLQGFYSDAGRLSDKERDQMISDAMKLVVDNEEVARERLSQTSLCTIGTWYDKYQSPLQGIALKKGEFWNHEILEFYIEIAQLKVQLYYFREFLVDQYVLLKTRKAMERIEGLKVVSILELLNGHKLLIKEYEGSVSVEDLLDNTNFDSLIDITDACSSYDENTFISIGICKKVNVNHDGTCGYSSIAKSIGISADSIIRQLSEYYTNEFDESTNSILFHRGKKLKDWIRSNVSQTTMPEELWLISDDGM